MSDRSSSIARFLGVLCLALAIPFNAALAQEPAPAAKPVTTVRPEVGKPIQAALDLLKQKKGKEALAKLREVDAIKDKTPYEEFVTEQVRGQTAAAAGEPGVAARAFEGIAASALAAEKDKAQFLGAAASQYYQAKDYAKSADLVGRYFKAGGNDNAFHMLQVQALYLGNNFALAAKELLVDIQADEQAGKTPAEMQLQMLSSAYDKQQDKAGYAHALEKLLTYYPKKDYWLAGIYSVTSRSGFPDRMALDVSRLRHATGTMRTADDYVNAAQLALQAGFPAEAKRYLDAGYAAGLLGTGAEADRHKRLKDLTAKNLAADVKALGQDDAQVSAAKDGTALFNSGLNYVLHGRADKGLGMMESGIAKGGLKHPDDARLQLGYAYHLAGQPQKALLVLKKIQGTDGVAALARLWAIRAGQT
ncbi:MAG: hypothetical protein NT159_22530 [Proteobacteria bacterium]|nr:hypothetical protein [Pseudomonadota bacterium]